MEKTLLNTKCVFWFSLQLSFETFPIVRRTEGDIIKHVYWSNTCYALGLGWRSSQGAALLVGRSRDRLTVVSLDFSVTYSFRPYHGPGVDSAPSENE